MHFYTNIFKKSSKNQEKSGVYVFTSHAVNNQQIFIIYEDSVPNKFIIQELFTEMKNIESFLSYAKNQSQPHDFFSSFGHCDVLVSSSPWY